MPVSLGFHTQGFARRQQQDKEEYTDPEMMYKNFGNLVDFVIDGGIGAMLPSIVVDYTTEPHTIFRQELGEAL